MTATIRPTQEEDVPELTAVLARIVEERRYLGTVHPPSVERMVGFCRRIWKDGVVQVIVEVDGRIVGWCDAMRLTEEGFRHNATLGIGLLPEWRGRGLGRRLLDKVLTRCGEAGVERVELSVYADNAPAIRLYHSVGFEDEGLRRRQRFLDGVYWDVLMMAKFLA